MHKNTISGGTVVFLVLGAIIGALFFHQAFAEYSGTPTNNRSLQVIDYSLLISVWFCLVFLAYKRNSFERWCNVFQLKAVGSWYAKLASVIDTSYRPMVRTLESIDEVSLAARDLIIGSQAASLFLNGKIIFLGAAANQSDRSRRDSLSISEDSERTPAQVYQGAVEEVMSKLNPVYRVVSLLEDDEFATRSLTKKRQYLSWLRNQVSQLKRNKNYVLFDNKRAPKWGASGAAIFTSSGYLQFTSAGGNALFVKDEWLSRHLVAAVMTELGGAKLENKSAYTQMENEEFSLYSDHGEFGQNIPAEALEAHLTKLNDTLK